MGWAHIKERPKLAARIAAISALWTEIDVLLGSIIAYVLGVDAVIAVTLYLSIENEGSKMGMIDGLAQKKLTKSEYEELAKLLAKIRKRRKDRNNLVHGIWGISEEFVDELVWQDPREAISLVADIFQIANKIITPKPEIKPNYMLYSVTDFDQIEKNGSDLYREVTLFCNKMTRNYGIQSISYGPQHLPQYGSPHVPRDLHKTNRKS